MAFRDFTFPQVATDFGLSLRDDDLYADVGPVAVREPFAEVVRDGVELAVAIGTEKAKSEFIIAPVLLELRRASGRRLKLFSGVEWNPDPKRGLNGYCDFLLTRSPTQYALQTPFVAVAEAKNDLIATGLGQCVAAMYAARVCNDRDGTPGPVHGIVSTGTAWKFLRLDGDRLTIDVPEYLVDNLPKLMAILRHVAGVPV